MTVLIVNESLQLATQLYYQFIRHYEIPVSTLTKHRRECRYDGVLIRFISKADLDICTRGYRNIKIIHGPDVEAYLDKEKTND